MHFLTDIVVAILTGYLAFTNTLALQVESFMDRFQTQSEITSTEVEILEKSFPSLPGVVEQVIPDILLRSAEYQAAAVGSAGGLTGTTTKEPLDAIVNIFCTFTTKELIRTTTGTGFFIDPDGVIMTNAHVAQFLLLEGTNELGDTECIVRSGNPASPHYHAELLYLPPAWIQENASVIKDKVPMGTGERDYALLYVNRGVDNTPLPAQFPALSFDTELLPITTKQKTVLIAGYPATALLKEGADADLIPKKANTRVTELYTFGSNYADVFSIQGSEVGAEGSSGGPVLNERDQVIGMIVTRGDDQADGPGSLRAITLSHVERTMIEETNFTLAQNLGGNLAYRSKVFADTLSPFLLKILQYSN